MANRDTTGNTATVAVSGAVGFLGSHLVRGFEARGAKVLPLVRVVDGRSAAAARVLEEAVGDPAALAGLDVFVHTAAVRSRYGVDPETYPATNVELVERAMRTCAAADVRRFVFVSAVGVYGFPHQLPVTEANPYAPRTPYFGAKVEAEMRAKRIARELPIELVIVRPSMVYGPGDRTGFLGKMAAMIRGGTYRVVGPGDNVLHHVHVDDIVEGLWLASTLPEAAGDDFILAGPETTTLERLSLQVAGAVGRALPRMHVPSAVARAIATAVDAAAQSGAAFTSWEPPLTHEMLDVMTLPIEFDIGKARRRLGFAPVVGYDEGVMRTLRGQWPTVARFGAES